MASALIRRHCCDSESPDETEVLQLSGGIERYLQAYPQRRREDAEATAGVPTAAAAAADVVALEREEKGDPGKGGGECGGDGGSGGDRHGVGEIEAYAPGVGAEEGFFRGKNFVFDER